MHNIRTKLPRCIIFGVSLLLASLIVSVAAAEPATFSVTGRIVDQETSRPVSDVNVHMIETDLRTATDSSGKFRFSNVAEGVYTLNVSHVGYFSSTFDRIVVGVESEVNLVLTLSPRAVILKTILVTPGTFEIMDTPASRKQALSREDIQAIAQIREDVYRTVNRLPGVASDDYSARFTVRGGRYEDVLVRFDGLELYEPFHVRDVNGSVVSIIDPEAIEGITLMTGGFTAEYGNRQSAVFDIRSRKQQNDRRTVNVGISLINFRVMTEGTFSGNRGSYFLIARRGYLDLVLDLMRVLETPWPTYYDVLSRVSYRLSPSHELSFNLLYSYDKMKFQSSDPDGDFDQSNMRYDNSFGWLTLKSTLGSGVSVTNMLSSGQVKHDRYGQTYNSLTDLLSFRVNDETTFKQYEIKQDWYADLSDHMQLKWGFDYKDVSADYNSNSDAVDSTENAQGRPVLDTVSTFADFYRDGLIFGGYVSGRVRVLPPLAFEIGGRYDHGSYSDDKDFSPRLNAIVKTGPTTMIRLGWGYYRQIQPIQNLDLLDNVSAYYPSELAQQWSAGVEHDLPSGVNLRVEAYYAKSDNPKPSFRNWKNDFYQFHNKVEDDRIAVFRDGFVRKGLEVYARKTTGKHLTWMFSYALSYNHETIDSVTSHFYSISHGKEAPAPLDQRHTFNLDGSYRISKTWSMNVSFTFHTGWFYTPARIDTVSGGGETAYYLRPGEFLSERLPFYSSLNVRATRSFSMYGGKLRLFLDLINILGRQNVYGVDAIIEGAPDEYHLVNENLTWLSFMPSFGLSWTKSF